METYSAATVAEATGASVVTLQRYVQQGIIELQPCDGRSRGSGDKRKYSRRRVMQIAITLECSRLGIAPKRGGKAALEFSDRGNSNRGIGDLFPRGTTYLVGFPDGANKVLNVPPDKSIIDVLAGDTAFIVNVNSVAAKVTEKLETK